MKRVGGLGFLPAPLDPIVMVPEKERLQYNAGMEI